MIPEDYVLQASTFIGSGLLGMLYAYAWQWSSTPSTKSIAQYLFGDSKALIRALLVFISMCAGTISLSYLENLDTIQTIVAGIGIGLLVPSNVVKRGEHAEIK